MNIAHGRIIAAAMLICGALWLLFDALDKLKALEQVMEIQ